MRNGIGFYSSCVDCWRKESAVWWNGKEFKVCKRCDHKIPLRKFQRDTYGVPYSHCNDCHETEVDVRYRREKGLTCTPAKKVAIATASDAKPINS